MRHGASCWVTAGHEGAECAVETKKRMAKNAIRRAMDEMLKGDQLELGNNCLMKILEFEL